MFHTQTLIYSPFLSILDFLICFFILSASLELQFPALGHPVAIQWSLGSSGLPLLLLHALVIPSCIKVSKVGEKIRSGEEQNDTVKKKKKKVSVAKTNTRECLY